MITFKEFCELEELINLEAISEAISEANPIDYAGDDSLDFAEYMKAAGAKVKPKNNNWQSRLSGLVDRSNPTSIEDWSKLHIFQKVALFQKYGIRLSPNMQKEFMGRMARRRKKMGRVF